MTIIITTHYIEEARRSHLVGFMKKGFLMAENTPEALYEAYETRTLERIFYLLCRNEKMRKSSTVKRNSTGGKTLKKSQSQLQRALSQSEEERRKNFHFHNFEV
jgi:ABC-type multidrug transport system ATPase subunit